ncbi:ferrated catecholamine ABC transporter substrate-binding lipoprotein SstD [Macrococcus animalis]|uniref:ferrated catecholamine ABC transporter substrate-binding lipoprotein SstD n=1 Tax=Macrococcus animalis TaxID=3395467 RepID=UPI0039BE29F4
MKRIFSLVLTFTLILVLAACGGTKDNAKTEDKTAGKTDKAETVKIENKYKMMGEKEDGSDAKDVAETIEIPKNPKNIAVFDYGTLATMKELGVDGEVKGLPKGEGNKSVPSFLENFKDKKYANLGNLKEPNFEKLAELQPELILISGRQANQKVMEEMKKAAPEAKILYVGTDDANYIGSVKTNTENIGKVFDKEKEATALIEDLDKKIEEVKAMTEKSKDKGLFILANEGELSVFGKGGRFGFIHDVLGVKEADEKIQAKGHGQVINFEYINKTNPDIIYAMDRGIAVGGKSSAKQALTNDVIKDVNAVKNDKVVEIDPYLWYFSGGGAVTVKKQIEEVEKAYK